MFGDLIPHHSNLISYKNHHLSLCQHSLFSDCHLPLCFGELLLKKPASFSASASCCSSELGSAVGYTWPVTAHTVCQQQATNHFLYLQHSSLIASQSSYLLSLLAPALEFMLLNPQGYILKVLSRMCLPLRPQAYHPG